MRHILIGFVCCIVSVATTARAEKIDYLPGLSPADHYEFQSETLGRSFHIFVRLPENYDAAEDNFPTVYLLDGDILFPIIGAYHYLLSFDEPVPEAIIVGISYGTFDRENGNYRGTDYSTPPLPEEFRGGVDHGGPEGGAAAYQKFLSEELLPFIEDKYRSDPTRRILLGQSRGGHFVLYSAMSRPGLFWGRIASNPSLEPNKDAFFQDLKAAASNETHLFFSSGSRDFRDLRKDTLALFEHLSAQEQKPWRLNAVSLEGETHAAGIANVYRRAMLWLFPENPAENPPSDD